MQIIKIILAYIKNNPYLALEIKDKKKYGKGRDSRSR